MLKQGVFMEKELEQIENLKNSKNITKRVVSEALEEKLFTINEVLDHGFIRVVDYMGTDASIVQAARVSYGAGTKQTTDDKALINYLMRNDHTSPFEMCEIKLHVKLPIFVARQWIRHRTASVNEYSARYSILKNEFYLPKEENICEQSTFNKQGRGDSIDSNFAGRVIDMLKAESMQAYHNYQNMLNIDDENNVIDQNRPKIAREIARINLPLSMYTEWYWKIDLHNLLHFLRLRMNPHAQYEIREYANVIAEIVKSWVPFTYEAFMKYKINNMTLTNSSVNILKKIIKGEDVKFEDYDLSKGEWNELMKKFEINEKLI